MSKYARSMLSDTGPPRLSVKASTLLLGARERDGALVSLEANLPAKISALGFVEAPGEFPSERRAENLSRKSSSSDRDDAPVVFGASSPAKMSALGFVEATGAFPSERRAENLSRKSSSNFAVSAFLSPVAAAFRDEEACRWLVCDIERRSACAD